MQEISNQFKEMMNNMAMQYLSFALAIAITYVVTYIILSIIKAPVVLRKFISIIAMLVAMYYSYNKIFLS